MHIAVLFIIAKTWRKLRSPSASGWLNQLLFGCPVTSDSLWPHGLQQPGVPVTAHLPEFARVRGRCICDAVQPSHPRMPAPPALSLPQLPLVTVCSAPAAYCFSRVQLCATLRTAALQAPLSMGFSSQENQCGLPCPTPGNLPGIKPGAPALQAESLPLSHKEVSVQWTIIHG